MVVLSKPDIDQFTPNKPCKPLPFHPTIPIIDLSKSDSKSLIVKACEEFGFFKVVNHGVPFETINKLESEAIKFFSLPLCEKEKAGAPDPFGYGNNRIGLNGDAGWVEYLLLMTNSEFNYHRLASIVGENPEILLCSCALEDYLTAVKKMACEVLELMAEGLKIQQRNIMSKLLMDEQNDSVFRINYYPPCSDMNKDMNLIGFGEHTDPQIISVLRSNDSSGLQISLKDGSWVSVPPDCSSFFINVGDSLQVMTNGRFKSVRHRVVANCSKSRVSMIYFGGPPLTEKIAPLASLMDDQDSSLYKEFTWFEYKKSAYKSRLADNRLCHFEKIAAS